MTPLEKEILKYEKRGFKVASRRTLKYGLRIILEKEKRALITYGYDVVYIYYTEEESKIDSIRECLRDYESYYKQNELSGNDKGFYICLGMIDEKLFRDLKKAMIRDDAIRNSIRAVCLEGESKEIESEKEIEKEKLKKAIEKEEEQVEPPEVSDIINKIKKFIPPRIPESEKELDVMLVSYLSAFYRNVETKVAYENAKVDVKIGRIGIEIKFQPSASEFDRLYGQIDKYLKYLDVVIIVIGYERGRENTERFKQRLKERDWLGKKAFLVNIK